MKMVKNILKDHTFIFYNRYADSMLLIHDNTRTNPEHISTRMNKLHKNVQFKVKTQSVTGTFILGTIHFIKPHCCISFK